MDKKETIEIPDARYLVVYHDPVGCYDREPARWGYREVWVFNHDGKHWAVPVYVTTGDEGGVEAEGEACQVRKVEVTSHKWEAVK